MALTPQASKEAQVAFQLNHSFELMDKLAASLSALENRLVDVLDPHTEGIPKPGLPEHKVLVPLANRLEELNNKLSDRIRDIQQMEERIEL